MVLTVHEARPFNGMVWQLQRNRRDQHHGRSRRGDRDTEEARPAGFRWRSRTAAGPIPHGLLNDVIPVAVRAPQVLDGIRFLLFARLKPYRGSDLLIETFRLWPPDIGGRVEIWIVVKRQIAVGPLVTAVRDPGG